MTNITVEDFLNSKLKNFISFIGERFGKENKLYTQITQLDTHGLINYADYVSKACDLVDKKYTLKDEIVEKYLEENGVKVESKEDVIKLKRYLEMFVNVVCV